MQQLSSYNKDPSLQERALLRNLGQYDNNNKKEQLPHLCCPYNKPTKMLLVYYTFRNQNASLCGFTLERR